MILHIKKFKGVGVIIAEKVDLVMLIRAIHCNGMNSQQSVLVADSVVDIPEVISAMHISAEKVRKCAQPYVYTLGNNNLHH